MRNTDCVVLENFKLDESIYIVNEYISLSEVEEKVVMVVEDNIEDCYESNGLLFYRALQLALPRMNIRVKKADIGNESLFNVLKDWNTRLMNYYSAKDNNIDESATKILIKSEDIEHVKDIHKIIIEHNKNYKSKRENNEWEATRWLYAYQNYISACSSISLDASILHLITGLEALLVSSEGSLTYRVSLGASLISCNSYEERKLIFDLVKEMYKIRSKVVHGEIKAVIKLLSKEDIYDKYYTLKEILSIILLKLYKMNEGDVFNRIEKLLLSSPIFDYDLGDE